MACRLDGAKPLSEMMLDFFNWTLRNKLQWNFNRTSNIFIEENTFENVVCEMSSILSRPQCVKERLQISSHDISLKITNLKLQLHLPGTRDIFAWFCPPWEHHYLLWWYKPTACQETTRIAISISDKMSYQKILWWLKAARFVFRFVQLFRNLTGYLSSTAAGGAC